MQTARREFLRRQTQVDVAGVGDLEFVGPARGDKLPGPDLCQGRTVGCLVLERHHVLL